MSFSSSVWGVTSSFTTWADAYTGGNRWDVSEYIGFDEKMEI